MRYLYLAVIVVFFSVFCILTQVAAQEQPVIIENVKYSELKEAQPLNYSLSFSMATNEQGIYMPVSRVQEPFLQNPEEGKIFIVVGFRLKNLSEQTASIKPEDLLLVDDTGQVYKGSFWVPMEVKSGGAWAGYEMRASNKEILVISSAGSLNDASGGFSMGTAEGGISIASQLSGDEFKMLFIIPDSKKQKLKLRLSGGNVRSLVEVLN